MQAITFDFWGTLADGSRELSAERSEFLSRYLPGTTPGEVEDAYEVARADFQRGTDSGYGISPAMVLSATLDQLGASLKPPDRQVVLRLWEEAILVQPPPLLPCASDVLREVRRRGMLVGLISDTGVTPGHVVRRFLASEGLATLFDWLTFSDEIGVTKRRPQAFSATLRALGVPASDALHVGDLPETDMKGGRAAGMHTALVLESSRRTDAIPLADIVLDRLADLPSALRDSATSRGG